MVITSFKRNFKSLNIHVLSEPSRLVVQDKQILCERRNHYDKYACELLVTTGTDQA